MTGEEEVGEQTRDRGEAGRLETWMRRHNDRERVKEERGEAAESEGAEGWGEWKGRVNLAVDAKEFTDNGTVGETGESSADLGAELLDRSADALCALLDAIRDRDPAPRAD